MRRHVVDGTKKLVFDFCAGFIDLKSGATTRFDAHDMSRRFLLCLWRFLLHPDFFTSCEVRFFCDGARLGNLVPSDCRFWLLYIYTLVTYTTVFSISLREATLQVDVLKTLTGMLSLSAQSLVVWRCHQIHCLRTEQVKPFLQYHIRFMLQSEICKQATSDLESSNESRGWNVGRKDSKTTQTGTLAYLRYTSELLAGSRLLNANYNQAIRQLLPLPKTRHPKHEEGALSLQCHARSGIFRWSFRFLYWLMPLFVSYLRECNIHICLALHQAQRR